MSTDRAVYDAAAYASLRLVSSAMGLDAVTLASSPAVPGLLSKALRLMPAATLVERLLASGELAGAADPYAVVVWRLR